MTRLGHSLEVIGIVQYASATSRTDACDPGSRLEIRAATVLKVPQVHGKLLIFIEELMEEIEDKGEYGEEKLCTAQRDVSLPGLGMRDRGEDWKGPIKSSILSWEKGPRYLLF